MLRNFAHAHPVAFGEDGKLVLFDVAHPLAGAPDLPDDQARETGRKVALWLLELLGPKATTAKLAGLRFAFHLEQRSMEKVASDYGIGRTAISKWRVIYCKKFGLALGKSDHARAAYSRIQINAWKTRRRAATTP